ncbi:MAG: DUF4831 family protein [Rikenellaceae bacterium]|nr:DUF4831 family protein [Rikenellaceae bacterium]
MKRILLTLTMALVATTLYAQNPYLSLEGVVAKADGSVELLQPTTTLTVDLTVTCEETLCGPYARYAQKFLGVRAPLTDKKIWSITGADVALAGEEVLAPQTLAAPSIEFAQYAEGKEEFATLAIDKKSFLAPTLEDAARAAAETIFSLRKHRMELITGEAGENVFGEGLQAALAEIDAQEQAHLELFFGKQSKKSRSYRFVVAPEQSKLQYIVCRFSEEAGILPSSDLTGSMVVLQIIPDEQVACTIPEAGPKATSTATCVVANRADCVVMAASDELIRKELPIFQYGRRVVIALPTRK